MKTKYYLPLLASLALLLPSLISAANLVSCVSCSNVTCPAGTVCGNIGTCPNGFIKWGCKYPNNGMPVATSLNATLQVNTTTIATTTVPAPATTPPPAPSVPVSPFGLEWLAALVVILIVVILVYYFVVAKRISKQ
ncbi:MAG: hypothetical protein ACP5IK_02595 [Candidatus Micrarchaeia archaeon]